jgi:DNA recombination protein RmuC
MFTNILLVLALVMIAGLGFMVFTMMERLRAMKDQQNNDKGALLINQNMQGFNERLDKTTESLNARLDKAAQFIASVHKELGTVGERFKRFEEFNELLHPKLRGLIGERIMADMIAQAFPAAQYELQYRFKNGETVDAIIKTKAGLLPVDSKFPLDNFQQIVNALTDADRATATKSFAKAVKKHIDDIAAKYILPEEGTVNFSVMYVPSENIYYQMVSDDEGSLLEYAKQKGILVTSPNGFFFMMRIIYMSLERERMQEQAMRIWEILKGVQQESGRFREDLDLLSKHLGNSKNAMDSVYKGYDRLSSKLDQIKLLE